jgi:hypothetical protein
MRAAWLLVFFLLCGFAAKDDLSIYDAPIEEMPRLPQELRSLRLVNTRVRSLAPARGLRLEVLDVRGSPIADLEVLRAFPAMKQLAVSRLTRLEILDGMAGLEWLTVDGYTCADGALDLAPLARHQTLTQLDVAGTPVRSFAPLLALPRLAVVRVSRGAIPPAVRARLRASLLEADVPLPRC